MYGFAWCAIQVCQLQGCDLMVKRIAHYTLHPVFVELLAQLRIAVHPPRRYSMPFALGLLLQKDLVVHFALFLISALPIAPAALQGNKIG